MLTRVSPEDSLPVGGDITLTATVDTDPRPSTRLSGSRSTRPGPNSSARSPGGTSRQRQQRPGTWPSCSTTRSCRPPTIQSARSPAAARSPGKFDRKTVDRHVHILRSGALSAELSEKPVSENTIGPTLGARHDPQGDDGRRPGLRRRAVFMLVYYRFAGMVACVALLANLLLTVGFMVASTPRSRCPGLAGLVLMLGMAVDANVLIYERLREEREQGREPRHRHPQRLRPGLPDDHRHAPDEHLHRHRAVRRRQRPAEGLRHQPDGRPHHQPVHVAVHDPADVRLLAAQAVADRAEDDAAVRAGRTFNPMKYPVRSSSPLTAALTVAGLGLFLVRGEDVLNVDFRGGTVFAGRLKEGEERGLTTTGRQARLPRTARARSGRRSGSSRTSGATDPLGERADADDVAVAQHVRLHHHLRATTRRATVTLKPEAAPGDTPEAMAKDVIARASQLPDVSVEQMFLSGESYADGKSRYFTIRTTETATGTGPGQPRPAASRQGRASRSWPGRS